MTREYNWGRSTLLISVIVCQSFYLQLQWLGLCSFLLPLLKCCISNSLLPEREEALNPLSLVVVNCWMTKCFIWSSTRAGCRLLQIAALPLRMKDILCCYPRFSKGACQQSSFYWLSAAEKEKIVIWPPHCSMGLLCCCVMCRRWFHCTYNKYLTDSVS